MKKFTILITVFGLITISNCNQSNKQTQTSETEFVKSFDGVDIAYQVHGSDAIALVFIHGWCCDKSYWEHQTNYYKNQYKVVIIDLAGHGESGVSRTNYTIQSFANDVTAVIKQLKLNDFILLGHSLGGSVVVETATQNLATTRAIFVIDSFRKFPKKRTDQELIELENKWRNHWKEEDFQSKTYNDVKSGYYPTTDSTLIEWIAKDMSSALPRIGKDALVNLSLYKNRDLTKSLKLIGDIEMVSINARISPDINDFRDYGVNFIDDVLMDSVSHFLMMSHPETFNTLLSEQLQKVTSNSH